MKDIICHPNFISNHIFLSTFPRTINFNLPPVWSCLINCSIPKRDCFVSGIISSKASKTRASGLPVEEANVATVVVMN